MTGPLLIGVAASFLAGSFGYILFQFWLKPMLKYRRIKHRTAKALDGIGTPGADGAKGRQEAIRQLAADLSACYNEQLPDWFQLLLKRRQESPLDAAAGLMRLANTRHPEHAARQVASIRKLLKLDALPMCLGRR